MTSLHTILATAFEGDNVLALDPGKTTGYAKYFGSIVVSGDFIWPEQASVLHGMLVEADQIIIEDFRLYAHKAKAQIGQRPVSVEVIGFVLGLMEINGWDKKITFQMASQAKLTGIDEYLKQVRFKQRSAHSGDATKHLIYRALNVRYGRDKKNESA